MRTRNFAPLVLAATLVSGCGGSDEPDQPQPPATYVQAKQKWTVEGNLNYHFTVRKSCFCIPQGPVEVTVRAGSVFSAKLLDTGASLGAAQLAGLPTLADLFAQADSAYIQGAAAIQFTANPVHGFLEQLFIDYSAITADDEVSYSITDFARDS
jgi:hypothetical protein